MDTQKTYKREVAAVMLLFLAALVVAGIIWPDTIAWEAAKFFTLPIFTFAGASFGADFYAKQVR